MPRKTALLVVLAALLGAGSAGSANAQGVPADDPARVSSTYTDTTGVVHYAFDPVTIPNAKVERFSGTRAPDGTCSITVSHTADASDRLAVVGSEISFDPTTCVSEYAIGAYPVDEVPAVVTERFSELSTQRTAPAPDTSATRSAVAAAATYYYAWFVVRYSDPVNIGVNWVTSRVVV